MMRLRDEVHYQYRLNLQRWDSSLDLKFLPTIFQSSPPLMIRLRQVRVLCQLTPLDLLEAVHWNHLVSQLGSIHIYSAQLQGKFGSIYKEILTKTQI